MTDFNKFPGGKAPSVKHMPKCSGKMSSAKVLTKGVSPSYGMQNASGRVGASTRCFKNTMTKRAGK